MGRITILVALVLFNVSCSLQANLEDLSQSPLKTAQTNEMIAASDQKAVSQDGYKVQASVNHMKANMTVTTQDGYVVQTSVQSTLWEVEQ